MVSETFPHSYTSPHIHSWIFKTLRVIIFWVRVTHKMLNVNWEKIHSIILCITCHGLRNFPPLIHIPSYPFMNFQNPASYYFWVRVTHKMLNVNWGKNSLNNFMYHLSWFQKLSSTHTHPLISIHEFSKPCELLFFELESLIKCWMWIGKKFTQ